MARNLNQDNQVVSSSEAPQSSQNGLLTDLGLGNMAGQGNTTGQLAQVGQVVGTLAPYFNQVSNSSLPTNTTAQTNAVASADPAMLQMLNSLYQQYGTQLAGTSGNVQTASQEAAAGANAASLNSAQGQSAIQSALAADQQVNPAYYSTVAATAPAVQSAIGDAEQTATGQLSGSMLDAIGRSVAQSGVQTGTTNAPSASQTAANAMQFGQGAYNMQQQGQSDLANAIGKATSFIPTTVNPNVNAFNVGTGQQGSANATNMFGSGINSGASTVNAANSTNANAANTSSLFATGTGLTSANNQLAANQTAASNAAMGGIIGGIGTAALAVL